jgi:hypothetical protein
MRSRTMHRKSPLARGLEFPLQRSRSPINRVEVAIVTQEIDEDIRDRRTGYDSPVCLELPFLRAALKIHRIQAVIIAAEIYCVSGDRRRPPATTRLALWCRTAISPCGMVLCLAQRKRHCARDSLGTPRRSWAWTVGHNNSSEAARKRGM